MPSKRTAVALAVALELSLEETNIIIDRKYDIFEINEVLFKYDQQMLGGEQYKFTTSYQITQSKTVGISFGS